MAWLDSLDTQLFHWVNPRMNCAWLDVVMPWLSGNQFFGPILFISAALLIWKGGPRGRLCVFFAAVAIMLSDGVVCNLLKETLHRPRPFLTLADVHVPDGIGRTTSGSMPSSHAANWFAASLVTFVFYRRSLFFMLPMALLVSFSRIYNGVHYPADVVAGAIVGLGTAAATLWTLEAFWNTAAKRWFPIWWERMPTVLNPAPASTHSVPVAQTASPAIRDRQFIILGRLIILLKLVANLAYLASGKIGLSGDEAYQWVWSKHLALSYYSKPLLIAVTQFLGTSLWGDNEFGVRFFSPLISALMAWVLLNFLARAANARVAFWMIAILPTIPIMAAGSILMTVDPLSVLFWTLAMISGWWAIQENSRVQDWLLMGLWMGLGFLSKYTALAQLVSWVFIFALWKPARQHLRKPGPWLALLVLLVCMLPVIIWNAQHNWITFHHVAQGGHFDEKTPFNLEHFKKVFKQFVPDFLGSEAGLINPFYFLPTVWAVFMFWKHRRERPLQFYCFWMGAPLFLGYALFTLHSRVLPNWIVPSVLPLLCLGALYWEERWRTGFKSIRFWLWPGIIVGLVVVLVMHDNSLVPRLSGLQLTSKSDVWARVEAWPETATVVDADRKRLEAEGKPVFIIGQHYQITGELSFYLPDAKAAIRSNPVVYYMSSKQPDNQFHFWPGYQNRKGQNALFVHEYSATVGEMEPLPANVAGEFESVEDWGERDIKFEGRVVRRIQLFACRNLK